MLNCSFMTLTTVDNGTDLDSLLPQHSSRLLREDGLTNVNRQTGSDNRHPYHPASHHEGLLPTPLCSHIRRREAPITPPPSQPASLEAFRACKPGHVRGDEGTCSRVKSGRHPRLTSAVGSLLFSICGVVTEATIASSLC